MKESTKKLSTIESVALNLLPKDKQEAVKALLLAEDKVEMEEAVLKDGETKVVAESWDAGQEIFIESEEGERIPAPEGEHTLADGRVLVVDADGKIVEVRAESSEEEEEEEEMSKDNALAELTKRLEALETRLSEAEGGRKSAETELSETKEALSKVQEEFTKLSAEPAEEAPVVAPKPAPEKVALSAQEEKQLIASMSPVERTRYLLDKKQLN